MNTSTLLQTVVPSPDAWVNDTIPIPPYLGLDGSQQAGLIAGYFIATIIATIGMVLALFNPCNADCNGCGNRDGARCCFCCPRKEENWCYLCCSLILLKLYYACCCRRCCRRGGRWASRRAATLKEFVQQEIDSEWEHMQREGEESGSDSDSDLGEGEDQEGAPKKKFAVE